MLGTRRPDMARERGPVVQTISPSHEGIGDKEVAPFSVVITRHLRVQPASEDISALPVSRVWVSSPSGTGARIETRILLKPGMS